MEIVLVVILTGFLLAIAIGGAVGFWLGVLAIAFFVGYRAYRVRCKKCGMKVIWGFGMRYCNQCGAEQPSGHSPRLRCASCKRMARSELNMNYCNRCGGAVE